MPRDSLRSQKYSIMCMKIRQLREIAMNHMQKYTTGIGKLQQNKKQRLFKNIFLNRGS